VAMLRPGASTRRTLARDGRRRRSEAAAGDHQGVRL
jgi:hypothetical protein